MPVPDYYFSRFDGSNQVVPKKPQNSRELAQCERIVNGVLNKYKQDVEMTERALVHFLFSYNRSASGIFINSASDLDMQLNFLSSLVDKKDIEVNFYPLKKNKYKQKNKKAVKPTLIRTQNSYWQKVKVSGIIINSKKEKVRNSSLYPMGKIELIVKHSKEKQLIDDDAKISRIKSRAIAFSLHLAAINLFDPIELCELLGVSFNGILYRVVVDEMVNREIEIKEFIDREYMLDYHETTL